MRDCFVFSSESVAEGHPDKVCDLISDSILDAYLRKDANSRVACEALCKGRHVVLAGEITSAVKVDEAQIVRQTIREIGYNDVERSFHAEGVEVLNFIGQQASDIALGLRDLRNLGAGDQGLMFGFATTDTPELMPLPITLAHNVTRALAAARKNMLVGWLGPDAKAQVSVRYENKQPVEVTTVVVSTQHRPGTSQDDIRQFVQTKLLPETLGKWWTDRVAVRVNPTGEFSLGGPEADCGLTGRKIMVDTYGGFARHGGGAFSGKDATKVDRSAAYFARFVARQIVKSGIARTVEIQVAYAIGVPEPISMLVDTWGTGDDEAAQEFALRFDFRPSAIIERLGLRRPIYRSTTNYGHFGKPELPWEH